MIISMKKTNKSLSKGRFPAAGRTGNKDSLCLISEQIKHFRGEFVVLYLQSFDRFDNSHL